MTPSAIHRRRRILDRLKAVAPPGRELPRRDHPHCEGVKDGSIIEFRSVVDAVRCALCGADRHGRAQRRPAARTSYRVSHRHSSRRRCRGSRRRPHGRRRERRGPARRDLRAGSDLFVRRRLPACQVPARLQVADLGPQSLKNIAEPMRAYLLRHGAPAAQKPPQAATRRAASGRAGLRWRPRLLSCF